jgi:hypothetical protein
VLVAHSCNPSYKKGLGGVAQGVSPELKKKKGLEGVVQVVEFLPSKCKALNSNLSTAKEEGRERERERERETETEIILLWAGGRPV